MAFFHGWSLHVEQCPGEGRKARTVAINGAVISLSASAARMLTKPSAPRVRVLVLVASPDSKSRWLAALLAGNQLHACHGGPREQTDGP